MTCGEPLEYALVIFPSSEMRVQMCRAHAESAKALGGLIVPDPRPGQCLLPPLAGPGRRAEEGAPVVVHGAQLSLGQAGDGGGRGSEDRPLADLAPGELVEIYGK